MKITRRTKLLIVALALCITTMIGSTFAWFTDTVESDINTIKAGNLDIELQYWNGTAYVDVTKDTKLFKTDVLWEPGHTEVAYLKITNAGNLALKYVLDVNVADEKTGINVAGDTFKLSDYLTVKVVEDKDASKGVYNRAEAVAATADTMGKEHNMITQGEVDYVALVVYMPTTVGNEANPKTGTPAPTVTLGVKLNATQDTVERDSFGTDYDKYALLPAEPWDGVTKVAPTADASGVLHVTSAAELVAMMDETGNSIYSGKTIVLDTDIDLNGNTVKGIGGDFNFAGIFDGQGHIISNFKIDASGREYYAGLFNQVSHGGTIKNLTVKNATVVGNSMVGAVASSVDSSAVVDNCKAIDCTLIGVKKVGAVVGYSAGSTVTNNYAENCSVFYSEKEGGEVLGFENTDSTVSNNTFKDVTVAQAQGTMVAEGVLQVAKRSYVVTGTNGLMNVKKIIDNASTGEGLVLKVKLMSDIDLSGKTWEPINKMWIEFDGNGHTISNLTTNAWQGGLFGYLGGSSIKNLTLENVNVTGAQAGAFAGSVDGTIDNCTLKGNNIITWAEKRQGEGANAVVETWNGVGAICGVMQPMTVNATIAEGASVKIVKTGMTTKADYVDELTGYISINKGTVTNKGNITVVQ